jgi:hypothetical protein
MALTSIVATWVKSIVDVGGETKYRLQTTCSSPVNIRDASLFVFSVTPNNYMQVAAVGDVLAYWPANPAVRRLNFAAATAVVDGDIGHVVTGGTSGDTGLLLGYSSDKKIWYVAPDTADDTFDPAEVATITGSGTHATITTVTGDTRYRAATVTQDFNTPQEAEAEETLQRTRLQNLITDWSNDYGSFPDTDTETISDG